MNWAYIYNRVYIEVCKPYGDGPCRCLDLTSKNRVKEYGAGEFYHLYNRGVEKRDIFVDQDDYKKFLSYLKLYLDPPNLRGRSLKDEEGHTIAPSRIYKNFHSLIELHTYCLMPNHFHILIKQVDDRSMENFMRASMTKYVMYFNKKYSRVGSLFQGRYKAVRVNSEMQFIYLSKYIHRNPLPDHPTGTVLEGLTNYKYSSYGNYLGKFKQSWVKTDDILHYFASHGPNSYKSFVEETGDLKLVYNEMIDMDY